MEAWAETVPHFEPPATAQEIARHLEFLSATLPSRNTDVETAKMRFAVYARMLAGHSNAALAFMAQEACKNFDWFPTPRQCLEILERYVRPASNRDVALHLVHQYRAAKFDEWIDRIPEMTDAEINAAPDRWKAIADCRMLIRRTDDGSYIKRRAA